MAVNDKDPTEAIQLVEQTIGTFNQIVVGQEGQMVPVPGYPDQPTLAERVKQNLKPSTDAAAGFATQAAASAKAADDAAKLASQITGLETVADAIGMAALPLPDVWAPLSDSLRMITGYGRDVLVGSDVVARMVNFSRNSTATYIGKDGLLKTAAANEPRFEKEGLLIEGQSTNLLIWSDDMSKLIQVNTSVSAGVITGAGAAGVQTRIEYGGVVPVGVSGYTITAEYDPSQSMGIVQLRVGGDESGWVEDSAPVTLEDSTRKMVRTITPDGWVRVSVTSKVPSSSNIIRINLAAKGAASGSVPTVGLTAKIRRVQVEALPFSSSYIPTAGAAVTRAQDLAWLPSYGNEPFGLVMSIAAEIDVLGKGLPSWPRPYELIESENNGAHIDMVYGAWDGAALIGRKTTIAMRFSDRSYWADGTKRPSKWNGYLNPFYTGNIYLFGTTNPARAFYGHVRNLRAWFAPLSDDQHKAIK